jgi:hypothetical protein
MSITYSGISVRVLRPSTTRGTRSGTQRGNNELLFAKGIFPYKWFDSFGNFDCTELPSKDAFYSKLDEEDITDEEYERAQNVWASIGCQNFKNYHDLYVTTDTLLLADVFENFRDVSMTNYRLDSAHYLTTPSLTWDACLKYTKVELELITDPEIFLFFESAMRGGISVISNRYARLTTRISNPKTTTVRSRIRTFTI